MRPWRIAYLPASLQPGGAERQMLALAAGLPKDRFTVEFMILSGPGIYDEQAQQAGARLRFLGSMPTGHEALPAKMARRIGKVVRYAQVARGTRYDVVDAWLYPSDVLAALMRPLTRTPIIIAGRRNVDPQTAFGPFERPVTALSGRLTDVVVANSEAAARRAIEVDRVDPAKIRIIRNGVVLPPQPAPGERERLRRAWDATDDEIVIGCVANYSPVKRHEQLIAAFGALVADGQRARLVLVGEGPMRPAMEEQIRALGLAAVVRLTGSTPDARAVYAGFDVAAQASCREGLPNALLEAAAAGRPIVATDAGGSGEIVLDGETGLLVPVDDEAAIVGALRRLVTDADLRRRLGAAAHDHAARAFGMDRFVAEFADLYEGQARARRLSERRPT
jgi:glycosyltransferase involved in cell wall biosynthesis